MRQTNDQHSRITKNQKASWQNQPKGNYRWVKYCQKDYENELLCKENEILRNKVKNLEYMIEEMKLNYENQIQTTKQQIKKIFNL